jgi:hypothetical protein
MGVIQLFDLDDDPSETKDLAKSHPELVAQAEKLFEEARTPNPEFPLIKSRHAPINDERGVMRVRTAKRTKNERMNPKTREALFSNNSASYLSLQRWAG